MIIRGPFMAIRVQQSCSHPVGSTSLRVRIFVRFVRFVFKKRKHPGGSQRYRQRHRCNKVALTPDGRFCYRFRTSSACPFTAAAQLLTSRSTAINQQSPTAINRALALSPSLTVGKKWKM